MEPPPVPTVTMSIMGSLTGKRPTAPVVVRCGAPFSIRQTSVEVPPASTVTRLGKPASSATAAAPSAPAAGPDSAVAMGRSVTCSAEITPPLDFMTRNGACARRVSRRWRTLPM